MPFYINNYQNPIKFKYLSDLLEVSHHRNKNTAVQICLCSSSSRLVENIRASECQRLIQSIRNCIAINWHHSTEYNCIWLSVELGIDILFNSIGLTTTKV